MTEQKKKNTALELFGAVGRSVLEGIVKTNGASPPSGQPGSQKQQAPQRAHGKAKNRGAQRVVHEHKHFVFDTEAVIAGITNGKYVFCKELAFRMVASELIQLRSDFEDGVGDYKYHI